MVSYPVVIDVKCVYLAVTDLSLKPLLCLKSRAWVNVTPEITFRRGAPPACSLGYVIVIEAIRFPGKLLLILQYQELWLLCVMVWSAEKGIRYIIVKTNASLKLWTCKLQWGLQKSPVCTVWSVIVEVFSSLWSDVYLLSFSCMHLTRPILGAKVTTSISSTLNSLPGGKHNNPTAMDTDILHWKENIVLAQYCYLSFLPFLHH